MWAIVVAGGTGRRFGRLKQFDLLVGRPVAQWSVEACRPGASGVVLVVPPGSEGRDDCGADRVVGGGPTRAASVRCGLAAVPGSADVIVVHDAARPLAPRALFDAVIAAVSGDGDGNGAGDETGAAICAIPVSDTIKRVAGEVVTETLDRSELVAVQTPQAFRADLLRRAHASGADATDDAALVELLGARVRVVPGDARNLKITTQADLRTAERYLGG
ncbi:MAG: 2-C-methyl-D-erythritol 4-phosphate cytidylyltransferase [Acidimicrobiales bacterium]